MKKCFVPTILLILLAAGASAQTSQPEWNPPLNLQKGFGESIKELLGNGLSDPRGTGELAVFEVLLGEGRGAPRKLVEAYGWPIPNTNKAVIIDGLTYEVSRRIRSASMEELVSQFKGGVGRFDACLQPTEAIVPLLLVRGDLPALQPLAKQSSWGPVSLANGLHYRYRMQIAQAMADGRDEDALSWVGTLVKLEQVSHDYDYSRLFIQDKDRVLASEIYKDIARRVADKQKAPTLAAIMELGQGARITALIKGLEDVLFEQPKDVSTPRSVIHPFVQVLIAEGETAIPALLDALEFDERLTRNYVVGQPTNIVRWHDTVRYWAAIALNASRMDGLRPADPQGKDVRRLRESYVERALRNAQSKNPVAPRLTAADWSPPASKLSPIYVEHARALLGNGLSDPRAGAGELHRLSITVKPDIFDQTAEAETYGWLLPGTNNAVCLDGLTYPVNKTLEVASVRDVLADIEKYRPSIRKSGVPWHAAAALFLIRGEVSAAEQIADATRSRPENLFRALGIRHRQILTQFLANGENYHALDAVEQMLKVQLVWHKFADPLNPEEVSPNILTVAKMRKSVQLRLISSSEKLDLTKLSSQPKSYRIQTLIELLDRTNLFAHGSVLSLSLQCPIMSALVAEGTDIVDPLLDVIQRDNRLTVSLAWSQMHSGYTGAITVKDAARAAIFEVWPESRAIVGLGTPVEYSAIKKAWDTAANNSPAERVLRALSSEVFDGYAFERNCLRLTTSPRPGVPRLFESLTPGQQKEFVDLLIALWRRYPLEQELWHIDDRLMISHEIAKVDPRSAVPLMENSIDSALKAYESLSDRTFFGSRLKTAFGTCARLRIPGTAQKYARFLALQPLNMRMGSDTLRPFMVAPTDDSQMRKVAERYFANWIKVVKEFKGPEVSPFADMVGRCHDGLLVVPAYRMFLAEALQLTGKYGHGKVSSTGSSYLLTPTPPYSNDDYELTETIRIKQGTSVTQPFITQGDFVALRLNNLRTCPKFDLGASEVKRKNALLEIAKWLKDPTVNWGEMGPSDSGYGEAPILPLQK